jgi:hypothetical protein
MTPCVQRPGGEGITTDACAEPAKAARDAQAWAVSPTVDDAGAAIGPHALDDQDVLERTAPPADPEM